MQTECAMICTMIMPQIHLARTKTENDVSIKKSCLENEKWMNLFPLTNKWSLVNMECFSDDSIGDVLSISDIMIIKERNCTVLVILQNKYPCNQRTDPRDVENDLKIRDLPFHPSIFKKYCL